MDIVAVATEDELGGIAAGLPETDEILGRPVYGDGPLVAVTGVGRTNASGVVAVALERYDADRVVSTGVAGALPGSGVGVGDTVVGSHTVHGDLGVEAPDGFGGTEHLGFETADGYHNSYPLEDIPEVGGERAGIATVATVSASDEAAERVAERTDAAVETMETVAVAQVARLYGVPASAVVGVSNRAGGDRDFDFAAGSDAVREALGVMYGW